MRIFLYIRGQKPRPLCYVYVFGRSVFRSEKMRALARGASFSIIFCAVVNFLCIPAQAVEFYGQDSQQIQPSDTEGGKDKVEPSQGDLNLTSEQLMIVQRALREAGQLCMVTGVFGKNTYRELMRYQREVGLKATGKIDKETLVKLNIYDKIFGDQKIDKILDN